MVIKLKNRLIFVQIDRLFGCFIIASLCELCSYKTYLTEPFRGFVMVYLQVWMASVFISFQWIQFRAAKARSTRLEDRVLKRLLLKGESICAGSW